jgi:hypothetical protein
MQEQFDGISRGGDTGGATGDLPWQALGHGDLVIDLGAGAVPTHFHELLAARFHIAATGMPGAAMAGAGRLAESLGTIAAATGHDRCSLVLRGPALPWALEALRARPDLIDALVLLAPRRDDDPTMIDTLSAAGLPLLVLSGTRGTDSPPEAGSRLRSRIPACHHVLVYDAGDAIDTDRPEAAASVVGDFLVLRDRFIVAHASGLIHP